MKKRDGSQMGIEFLDCPDDVRSLPRHELKSARVICLGEDINDCFPVLQGGVEGTLVSMPEECGSGFARAVSLEYAESKSHVRFQKIYFH
jgi:chitinase